MPAPVGGSEFWSTYTKCRLNRHLAVNPARQSEHVRHQAVAAGLPLLALSAGQFALHSFPQECRDRLAFVQHGIDPVPRPFRESRRDLFARFVDSLSAHAGDN
jgi:hypothetical protein